jgi:crotonobetainyl-CoA:carnitine CoA-transferase CaiB-like acyl-CoA transferase
MKTAGPLTGIKILDFTHVLSGPFGSALLGDLGADVIKIESPVGDSTRWAIPPAQNGESSYFFCVNRNKRSMSMDLKKPAAIKIVKQMVVTCDVVMENFRPGVMDRLGLGYDDLLAIKPDLVYASLTAFGEKGPYMNRPGYELIIQALTGLIDITSPAEGPPAKIQIQIVDLCAGMFLAYATLAALYHRLDTGEGQRVATSLLESTLAMTANLSAIYFMSGKVPSKMASRNPQTVPSQVFKTKDSYFAFVGRWDRFCKALGREDWVTHPDYSQNQYRVEHYDDVEKMVESVTTTRTTAEWLKIFSVHDMAANLINTMEEALEDPGVEAVDMIKTVQHSKAGFIRLMDKPWRLSATPGELRHAPPAFGEHATEILTEFGFKSADIKQWKKEGVLYEN